MELMIYFRCSTATASSEDDDSDITEDIAYVVRAGAEYGLSLFSRWLGLDQQLNGKNDAAANQTTPVRQASAQRSARGGITFPLPAQISYEERFKQLLIAQDNIHQEPVELGNGNVQSQHVPKTTYVYSKSLEAGNSSEPVANVVPRESRRGGRAYNIHRHVNEI